MGTLIFLIGLALFVIGIYFLIKPQSYKKMLRYFNTKKRMYAASSIKTLIGMFLLFVSGSCSSPFIIALIGLLSLSSLPVLVLVGPTKVLQIVASFYRKPNYFFRAMAGIIIVFSLLIMTAA
jgi:hypothetical protein